MAKKATNKKEENILNLESILFNCRDYLRGSASLNEKRDVILTLVFLRFIGEKFDDAQAEMRQQCIDRGITDEEKIARFLDSPSRYKNIVYVPEAARWSMLINVPTSDLVAALDDALQAIEDGGDALKGCVKLGLFTSVKIQPNELKKVVDEVNKISHKVFGEEKDLIGRVYEYFLKSFAVNATKEDGEFYTPHDIVELIAAFIEPFNGTLYDPCCGSGGMFIQCAKYVEAKQGDITAVNVFGQEKDDATFRLAKMNLAMRGISHHLGDGPISTFDKDWHAGLAFDYIMANPPFNLKHWFTKGVTQQGVNWADYGTPPESNANYAWILHILSKLKADKVLPASCLPMVRSATTIPLPFVRNSLRMTRWRRLSFCLVNCSIPPTYRLRFGFSIRTSAEVCTMGGCCVIAMAKSFLWICALGRKIQSKASRKRKWN